MNRKALVLAYVLSDLFSSAASWTIFFIFRKLYIEPLKFGYDVPLEFNHKFFLGLSLIPLFWITLYFLTGYYKEILRKTKLEDTVFTFFQTIFGVLFIFFFLILDDYISSYKSYYLLLGVLFSLHFLITLLLRWGLTSYIIDRIHKRKIGFNTLIIGSKKQAVKLYQELIHQKKSSGNVLIGFISFSTLHSDPLSRYLTNLGDLDNLEKIIKNNSIEEVILALEVNESDHISHILNKLGLYKVFIKAVPDLYGILFGKVKIEHLYGSPLIQIKSHLMPLWQENIKELIDITGSIVALLITSPLMLFIVIGIKISSPGPVIYSHERIGRYGKPFRFYKFRSMRVGAETSGPELSSKNDKRLTNFGRFLRKYRLDEIPNFFNVLKGDLSLVGPRPERKFYTKQIIKKAPHYIHLQRVKPGITSWGQVRYGYAENVDQMIKRLNYDILYIENMSLFTDFKILFYTLLTIIKGRGI